MVHTLGERSLQKVLCAEDTKEKKEETRRGEGQIPELKPLKVDSPQGEEPPKRGHKGEERRDKERGGPDSRAQAFEGGFFSGGEPPKEREGGQRKGKEEAEERKEGQSKRKEAQRKEEASKGKRKKRKGKERRAKEGKEEQRKGKEEGRKKTAEQKKNEKKR